MWGSPGWNQWALQPAMFNDVPHEQIDWAELAKQWIQMQQTQPADVVSAAPLPPHPPVALPPPPGHMPLMPEDFVEKPVTAPPIMKAPIPTPPAVIPEPAFHPERPFVENEAGPFLPKTAADNTFWSKSQWEASAAGDVDERMWPTPPVEPAASIIGGKETFDYGHMHDNPPLAMQSIDYNHMSDFSYNQVYPTPAPVPETHYDQYWSQVNAAPAISPIFLKKERTATSLPVDEVTSHLDAAKRKQLPAWIRDGLEKMEQERLKRLERERAIKESAEKHAKSGSLKKSLESGDPSPMALPSKSKFDSESEAEDEIESTIVKQMSPVRKPPPSPVEDLRTEEEKKLDLMLSVRRMLTEVLLTVTNSEMLSIAQEVYKKAVSKAPARQLASTTSQTSVASGLRGLANYGTESEASEVEEDHEKSDSEEELYRKIREKKKLFAVKEKKIIADLERKEREEKLDQEKLNNEKSEKKYNKELIINEKPNDVPSDLHNANKYSPSASEHSTQPILEVTSSEVTTMPENINSSSDEKHTQNIDLEVSNPPNLTKKEETNSSDSSSSSDSDSESEDRQKSKSHKETKRAKTVSKKSTKKEKNSGKRERRKRSKSRDRDRDSDSSSKRKRERSRDRSDKKSKKKKKYKRSDSSSSSSNGLRKKNRSSKYESSHNHRNRRSRSYDDRDRKHRRSVSPYRSHRKSDSHASSSHSHRYEDDKYHRKHRDEKKHRESRRSPSPKHSSRLPRKYRSSRSLSSESESSGKKLKKSRNR